MPVEISVFDVLGDWLSESLYDRVPHFVIVSWVMNCERFLGLWMTPWMRNVGIQRARTTLGKKLRHRLTRLPRQTVGKREACDWTAGRPRHSTGDCRGRHDGRWIGSEACWRVRPEAQTHRVMPRVSADVGHRCLPRPVSRQDPRDRVTRSSSASACVVVPKSDPPEPDRPSLASSRYDDGTWYGIIREWVQIVGRRCLIQPECRSNKRCGGDG